MEVVSIVLVYEDGSTEVLDCAFFGLVEATLMRYIESQRKIREN